MPSDLNFWKSSLYVGLRIAAERFTGAVTGAVVGVSVDSVDEPVCVVVTDGASLVLGVARYLMGRRGSQGSIRAIWSNRAVNVATGTGALLFACACNHRLVRSWTQRPMSTGTKWRLQAGDGGHDRLKKLLSADQLCLELLVLIGEGVVRPN